jgi:fatty-acyl-CoA synthase
MSEKPGDAAPPKGGALRRAILGLGVILLIAGVAFVAAGPFLFRAGVVDLKTAMAGMGQAALGSFVAAGLAGVLGFFLSIAGKRQRGAIVGLLVLVAAGIGGGALFGQNVMRGEFPPIYDVQTDWSQPVAFTESTLQVRRAENAVQIRDDAVIPENQGRWSGKTFAASQAEFYKDLKPLVVKAQPADATVAAANAAKQLGWDVMLSDPSAGVVEAVHHSRWYGLAADISVRVTPEGQGSRIDVRSASREAGPDMGSNASRVQQLLDEIAFALRGS